ncbi:GNAT family N-acetyltransferase [Mesorhizobium sp. LjRoot246]|uniref:GNAT family N-acetyltransferase n=1 Tax=Mesorhizobium sp. LjRoot246 TaxID=3342294 RepID=UPI003ED163E8
MSRNQDGRESVVIVRIADHDDIPQLLQLYRDLDPKDKEISLAEAQNRWKRLKDYLGSDIFVGCLDDTVVTTCTLIVIPNLTRGGASYALIENVVTRENHRRQGYGKAVLLQAIETAWQAGCYKVMLLTGSKRPATLKFYHDVGFEQNKTGFQMRRIPTRASS